MEWGEQEEEMEIPKKEHICLPFFIVLIKSPIETILKNICKTLHEEKIKCCGYRLEQFFLVGNGEDLYQGNDNGWQ